MAVQSFQLWLLLLLLAAVTSSAFHPTKLIGRHGLPKRFNPSGFSVDLPAEYQIHYYTQTLDHFNYKPESYSTFKQRYILNYKYWGGANNSSPIFVYTGEEGDITNDVQNNFITDLAARFNGLVLFIEHRYYGESMPFGSTKEAFRNVSTLGYLSSEQALADYAQVITAVKKNLSAKKSPVIALGASYGGTWFRLKYPHIVIGSVASSSPILYFDNIVPQNGYHSVVTKDFRGVSENCYYTVKHSWSEIDRIAAKPNGLLTLTKRFSTCRPIESARDLKGYMELLYISAAQYENPKSSQIVNACRAIHEAPKGTDILGKIFAAINAISLSGNHSCHDHKTFELDLRNTSAWDWQTCTEIVMPIGYKYNETMFQSDPFDIKNYTKDCVDTFGIGPRPHWATIEFGGHDIKTVLGRFGSNIIFSNGLRDPYSIGGVLEDISDSIVAIYTKEGSHCVDINSATPNDPEWLVVQHDKETKVVAAWIAQYYATLSIN